MVREVGFEPTTHGLRVRCATVTPFTLDAVSFLILTYPRIGLNCKLSSELTLLLAFSFALLFPKNIPHKGW